MILETNNEDYPSTATLYSITASIFTLGCYDIQFSLVIFCFFSITFPAFNLTLFLPLLGLGLHGDALQCVAGLGHLAGAVTGHALVPTPPASDLKKKGKKPFPSDAPMLCPSD